MWSQGAAKFANLDYEASLSQMQDQDFLGSSAAWVYRPGQQPVSSPFTLGGRGGGVCGKAELCF